MGILIAWIIFSIAEKNPISFLSIPMKAKINIPELV